MQSFLRSRFRFLLTHRVRESGFGFLPLSRRRIPYQSSAYCSSYCYHSSSNAPSPPDTQSCETIKKRERCTTEFIALVLQTPNEQLWKDLIVYALRLGTLSTQHLARLLRGVRASVHNDAPSNATRKESSPSSSPSLRLHRVVNVFQFVQEQQELLLHPNRDTRGQGESSPFLLTHRLIILLLVHLRRAAAVSPSQCTGEPRCSYSELWHFLSWMELHDLHIGSMKLIDDIEGTVELDIAEKDQKNFTEQSLLLRTVNRRQYLQQEREWCEGKRGTTRRCTKFVPVQRSPDTV